MTARTVSDSSTEKPVIMWFRDDLRIADNPALAHAAATGRPLLAVYIFDTESEEIRPPGSAQRWMLHHGLKALAKRLEKLGGRLDIFAGKSEPRLLDLVAKTGAEQIVWNRRADNGRVIDRRVKTRLAERGVAAESFQANLLYEPYRMATTSGGFYKVYSPFYRALADLGEPRAPIAAPAVLRAAEKPGGTVALDTLNLLPRKPNWAAGWEALWPAGEDGAKTRLDRFFDERAANYAERRDFLDGDHTSGLSPYLRFGMISPYQIWRALRHREDSGDLRASDAEKFRKELVWREFCHHLLFHFPSLATENFNEKFNSFPWRQADTPQFTAWKRGRTGYPIVDAGMRQLWQTGYMHNRARMVVASFLVKHLLFDWRHGETWFWETLIDGDPASNPANWQWVAGSGADAAPYFRIFNPVLQGEKFDPKGGYARKYVPEIAALPDKFIHSPWKAPKPVLKEADIALGKTYPEPMVDHSAARKRSLDALRSTRQVAS